MSGRVARAAVRGDDDGGFTLIEVLIVVIVLGVLAAIVVFSVSGLGDHGRESACAADESALTVASEAAHAKIAMYVDEASLHSLGFLHDVSVYHDTVDRAGAAPVSTAVVVDGGPVTVTRLPNGYRIVPDTGHVSPCT